MFKWRPEFNTGIELIDAQHLELFRIGREIHSLTRASDQFDRFDDIAELIFSLKNYAQEHFSYEEKLMQESNFPDIKAHIAEHSKFMDKLVSVGKMDFDKLQAEVLTELLMFVADWIEEHIIKSDFKYSEHLRTRS